MRFLVGTYFNRVPDFRRINDVCDGGAMRQSRGRRRRGRGAAHDETDHTADAQPGQRGGDAPQAACLPRPGGTQQAFRYRILKRTVKGRLQGLLVAPPGANALRIVSAAAGGYFADRRAVPTAA